MNNTSRNEAGQLIKSKPTNAMFRENHDRIYRKQSAQEWISELYISDPMISPDGWKDIPYETPITRSDFDARMARSTILLDHANFKK